MSEYFYPYCAASQGVPKQIASNLSEPRLCTNKTNHNRNYSKINNSIGSIYHIYHIYLAFDEEPVQVEFIFVQRNFSKFLSIFEFLFAYFYLPAMRRIRNLCIHLLNSLISVTNLI